MMLRNSSKSGKFAYCEQTSIAGALPHRSVPANAMCHELPLHALTKYYLTSENSINPLNGGRI